MTDGGIRKPTFWTFKFYKDVKEGVCVLRNDTMYIVKMKDGSFRGILWNKTMSGENMGTTKDIELAFSFDDGDKYSFITNTVDEDTTNPLKVWHVMGEPASLTAKQKAILESCDSPFVEAKLLDAVSDGVTGKQSVTAKFSLKENAVVYFELEKINLTSDRGYSYERAIKTV